MKNWIPAFAGMTVFVLCSAPLHASPKDDLEQTNKALEASQERQKQLAEQQLEIEEELGDLQRKLVAMASVVRGSEADVTSAEDKLHILDEQRALKDQVLAARKKNLQILTQAALRFSQTPPEAMVMMPGQTAQTVNAASAMKMAAQTVREEINAIGLQMKEIKRLEVKVAQRRNDVGRKQTTLDQDRDALQRQLNERKALQEKLVKQERQEAEKSAQLAKKAEDLQALMESLAKSEKQARAKAAGAKKGKARSFAGAKGNITMPLAGKIVQLFGDDNKQADTSKGILIEARKSAQVVAPFDGEVVFTGPFLSYGKMVILRHGSEFHTLLAGLATIDVAVGDFLLEGEPIGAMGKGAQDKRLYMELRKDSQPIDPKPWLSKN